MLKLFNNPKCSARNMTCILFFTCLCIALHVLIIRGTVNLVENIRSVIMVASRRSHQVLKDINDTKVILTWRKYYLLPTESFKKRLPPLMCPVNNCIYTEDKNYFDGNLSRFDALLFDEESLKLPLEELPSVSNRSSSQLYIFTTLESAVYHPACEVFHDDFFNWTFTTRLDSDLLFNYFFVLDAHGTVIAPKSNVVWKKELNRVPPSVKDMLKGKTKAAAWLVSNCEANSDREQYLTRLQEHLYHFALKIDVYGNCSKTECRDYNCEKMLRDDYYFYMAFENSFSDDYVTEKVLHGYNNYVVPIVYGGANYTRFLPPGSYINAREMHPYNLAVLMKELMEDPTLYESYFKWTNSYSILPATEVYHPFCRLCRALNSQRALYAPAHKKFRLWWNGLKGMKWCLSKEFWRENSEINSDKNFFKLY